MFLLVNIQNPIKIKKVQNNNYKKAKAILLGENSQNQCFLLHHICSIYKESRKIPQKKILNILGHTFLDYQLFLGRKQNNLLLGSSWSFTSIFII